MLLSVRYLFPKLFSVFTLLLVYIFSNKLLYSLNNSCSFSIFFFIVEFSSLDIIFIKMGGKEFYNFIMSINYTKIFLKPTLIVVINLTKNFEAKTKPVIID
jgi:hypothetical protein